MGGYIGQSSSRGRRRLHGGFSGPRHQGDCCFARPRQRSWQLAKFEEKPKLIDASTYAASVADVPCTHNANIRAEGVITERACFRTSCSRAWRLPSVNTLFNVE